MRTSAKLNKLYIILKVLMRTIQKMYFLLNLSHYVKSYGHSCQFLAFFTMPAFQIWPCHVTQEANFGKILFFPNFAFNIRKTYKISSRKALYFRSLSAKNITGGGGGGGRGGGKHPLSAFRVQRYFIYCLRWKRYN